MNPGTRGNHNETTGAYPTHPPTVKKLVAKNQLPHLLLYGPPGTGKTSTILALAREMYPGERGLHSICFTLFTAFMMSRHRLSHPGPPCILL